MARKKKEEIQVVAEKMKKPPYKIGDKVVVTFLSNRYPAVITSLRKNGERWIYSAKGIHDGTNYVHIGYNGTEKYANIWDKPKENLETTNE